MAINLTTNRINKLRYDPSGARIQRKWDAAVPGLGIEVFATGRLSWVYRYRINKKQRIITLGSSVDMSLDGARDKVLDLRGSLRDGIDPKQVLNKLSEQLTVSALVDHYKKSKYFKSRSADFQNNFPSAMRRHLLPVVGDQAVSAVARWQVRSIIEGLIDAGKEGAARGVLTHSRILFNYAVELELIENSPADHIKPKWTTTGKRDTWLDTDDKIRAAWFFKGAVQVRAMIRWMLLTGCRRDEARLIERKHLGDVWQVKDTKNNTDLILPVLPAMAAIISEMDSTFGKGRFLFPGTMEPGKPIPRGSWHYQLKSNAGFSAHEIRHTVETLLADLEVPAEHRDMVLNHAAKGSGAIYNHAAGVATKRKVLAKLHEKINKIVVDG